MRTLYEPTAILLSVLAGTQVLSGIAEGRAAERRREAEAAFLETQATQEAVAARRDVRDLEKEQRGLLARTRAALAGQGASLSGPGALSVLKDQRAEFEVRKSRTLSDSRLRQRSLRARAENTRAVGEAERDAAIFGGVARGAAVVGRSLLRRPAPTPSPKPGGRLTGRIFPTRRGFT